MPLIRRAGEVESSAIVVSYKPGEWLGPCLDSVLGHASEVIVVDNASEGGRASKIAEERGAIVVKAGSNLGFAGGVRLGLSRARGEIIGVLNDDAVASQNWLGAARAALEDETVAAVTPKVLLGGRHAEVLLPDAAWQAPGDARVLGRQIGSVTIGGVELLERVIGAGIHAVESGGSKRWRWSAGGVAFYVPIPASGGQLRIDGEPWPLVEAGPLLNHAGSFLRPYGMAAEYGFAAPDDGRFDRRAERFGFSGTAPVFRASTLERIGDFAPALFAYGEDTDWCMRAHLAGLRVIYDPAATVTHRLSATSGGQGSALVRMLAERNSLLSMVRSAPAAVAAHYVRRRIADGPGDGVRRSLLRRLPWALSTRASLRRQWRVSPEEVWGRWVDADSTWDVSPAGSARTSDSAASPDPS